MHAEFVKHEISLVSESLFVIIGCIQVVLLILTTLTYFLLVHVVWVHSPKNIGNYKSYIIINATFGFVFEILATSIHIYPLVPYPIIVFHGLFDVILMFGQPPQLFIDIFTNLILIAMTSFVYSTMWMFIFRLLQTTQSRYLKFANNIWFVLRTYIVSTIIISLTAYIPLNMQLLSNEELQRGIKAVDPETFAKMDGHIAVGFNARDSKNYLIAGGGLLSALMVITVIVVTCAFRCYNYLRRNKHMLTKKTLALSQSLINMLMMDLCFAITTGVTAIVASMLTFVFQYSWGSNIVILALLISSVYPLFTHILILTYVEPYRIASIRYQVLHDQRLISERSKKCSSSKERPDSSSSSITLIV